jgi:hypothetical protein
MSANGLFLVVSKRRTSGIEQLFSTLQDEKTKEVLRHNAVYKSFWYGKQMKTVSKADTMQVAQEATGDRLALVKTLVRRGNMYHFFSPQLPDCLLLPPG